jgi:hypothetical protein
LPTACLREAGHDGEIAEESDLEPGLGRQHDALDQGCG